MKNCFLRYSEVTFVRRCPHACWYSLLISQRDLRSSCQVLGNYVANSNVEVVRGNCNKITQLGTLLFLGVKPKIKTQIIPFLGDEFVNWCALFAILDACYGCISLLLGSFVRDLGWCLQLYLQSEHWNFLYVLPQNGTNNFDLNYRHIFRQAKLYTHTKGNRTKYK